MPKSSKKQKPEKPYPEFLLFAHATGRWAKKIKGKFRYFGPWDDSMGALERFQRTVHDIQLGRKPEEPNGGLSARQLVNSYPTHKKRLVESGKLTQRTWDESFATGKRLVEMLGHETSVPRLRREDFALLRA